MKKVSLLVFLSVLLISCGGKEVLFTSFSPVDYVNPLVGTQSKFTLSTGITVGNEFLDTANGRYGKWLGLLLYRRQDKRI